MATEPYAVSDEPADPSSHNEAPFDLGSIQLEDADQAELSAPTPRKRNKASDDAKPPPRTKARATAPPYRAGAYVKPVTALYGYASMGLSFFDPECGQAVMESAELCAQQWDALAKQNLAVRRVLQAMCEGGAWTGVVIAHLPIILTIASHHGTLPPVMRDMLLENMARMNAEDESGVNAEA